jgi:hypothetical protein
MQNTHANKDRDRPNLLFHILGQYYSAIQYNIKHKTIKLL